MAGADHILSKAYLATVAGFTNSIVLGQCVIQVDPGAGLQLDENQAALVGTGGGAAAQPAPIGLAAENLDLVKIQTGKAYFNVAVMGVAFGIADGTINAGATVIPSGTTAGRLISATRANPCTSRPQVGVAQTHAAAAGDLFLVLLTPGALV